MSELSGKPGEHLIRSKHQESSEGLKAQNREISGTLLSKYAPSRGKLIRVGLCMYRVGVLLDGWGALSESIGAPTMGPRHQGGQLSRYQRHKETRGKAPGGGRQS